MYEITWSLSTIVAEIFYCIIGIIFILTGLKALKDTECKERYFTAAFWFILAATFIVGPYIPTWITGACVVGLAALSALKKVVMTKSDVPTAEETRGNADKYGYKPFIPPITLALAAVIVATVFTNLGSNNAIGVSAVIALIVAFIGTIKPLARLGVTTSFQRSDNGTI